MLTQAFTEIGNMHANDPQKNKIRVFIKERTRAILIHGIHMIIRMGDLYFDTYSENPDAEPAQASIIIKDAQDVSI